MRASTEIYDRNARGGASLKTGSTKLRSALTPCLEFRTRGTERELYRQLPDRGAVATATTLGRRTLCRRRRIPGREWRRGGGRRRRRGRRATHEEEEAAERPRLRRLSLASGSAETTAAADCQLPRESAVLRTFGCVAGDEVGKILNSPEERPR